MYRLTNRNIYLRYLAEVEASKRRKASDKWAVRFTYKVMGELFMVTGQACYEWTRKKMPTGPRREAVRAWINDGEMDIYLERPKYAKA